MNYDCERCGSGRATVAGRWCNECWSAMCDQCASCGEPMGVAVEKVPVWVLAERRQSASARLTTAREIEMKTRRAHEAAASELESAVWAHEDACNACEEATT